MPTAHYPDSIPPIGHIAIAICAFLSIAPWVVIDAWVWKALLQG